MRPLGIFIAIVIILLLVVCACLKIQPEAPREPKKHIRWDPTTYADDGTTGELRD